MRACVRACLRVCVSQGVFQLVDTAGKHNKPRQDVHNHRGGLSLCSRYQFWNTWPLTPKSYFLILFGSLTKQRQRDVSSLSSFLCFYPFVCYLSSYETDDLYTHTHTRTQASRWSLCVTQIRLPLRLVCVRVGLVYECLLRVFRGNAWSRWFPIPLSLSAAFPHEWWAFATWPYGDLHLPSFFILLAMGSSLGIRISL